MVEPITVAGEVYYILNGKTIYIDPLHETDWSNLSRDKGYFLWTNNQIKLTSTMGAGATFFMRYYRYWNVPVADDDELEPPEFAFGAIQFAMAYYAISATALKHATINQWNEGGNPERNSVRAQQRQFMDMYQMEIGQFPRQNRAIAYREAHDFDL
ncbi:MAG: hypothetical protein HC892_00260 [Saprospiraceae bacterium]|nr:hypothetical protein [Saprospiraceae bacterium]